MELALLDQNTSTTGLELLLAGQKHISGHSGLGWVILNK